MMLETVTADLVLYADNCSIRIQCSDEINRITIRATENDEVLCDTSLSNEELIALRKFIKFAVG